MDPQGVLGGFIDPTSDSRGQFGRGGSTNLPPFTTRPIRSFSKSPWLKKPLTSPLGGGFKHFLFSLLPGEMIHFDEHIFQLG